MPDLYELSPANVEEFVVQWLSDLGEAGVERPLGAELPYRMVTCVSAISDPFLGAYEAIVSVHTFASTRTAASEAARLTDRRMNLLAAEQSDVAMFDGRIVNAEYVKTWQAPAWADYRDKSIERYLARYSIGLEFVAP